MKTWHIEGGKRVYQFLDILDYDADLVRSSRRAARRKDVRHVAPILWHGTLSHKDTDGRRVMFTGVIATPMRGASRLVMA